MSDEPLSLSDLTRLYQAQTPPQTHAPSSSEPLKQRSVSQASSKVGSNSPTPQFQQLERSVTKAQDSGIVHQHQASHRRTLPMENTLLKRHEAGQADAPVPTHILVTSEGQYDLSSPEGVVGANQEVRDVLTEIEQAMKRIHQTAQVRSQVRQAYSSLEKAAKLDASSDEIIKIGEKIAQLGEVIKTESPSKAELSALVMKIEMTRAVLSRYVDILWNY